jgi:hypothetical protein
MYGDHLIGVWSGWGASIIVYSMIHTSLNPSEYPTASTETVGPRYFRLGLHPYDPSPNTRCQNTSYRHDKDLIWVWSVWGASIIVYSMIQVRNRVIHLLPLWLWDQDISDWGCILMTTNHSWRRWNTSYRYEEDLIGVWSYIHVRNQVNLLPYCHHWLWGIYQVRVAPLWLLPQ